MFSSVCSHRPAMSAECRGFDSLLACSGSSVLLCRCHFLNIEVQLALHGVVLSSFTINVDVGFNFLPAMRNASGVTDFLDILHAVNLATCLHSWLQGGVLCFTLSPLIIAVAYSSSSVVSSTRFWLVLDHLPLHGH